MHTCTMQCKKKKKKKKKKHICIDTLLNVGQYVVGFFVFFLIFIEVRKL